jgi:adenosylcobinamide-GDP ribazoletransferase
VNDIPARFVQALRFWSRLPLPVFSFEAEPHGAPDMERLAPILPVAAAVLGFFGALALMIVYGFGLSGIPASIFTVAAMVIVTGAMHEDGLADMADGFGGGATVERKLEIMKDSRIGSYGATALMLSVASRITLTGELVYAVGPIRTGLIIIAAICVSRIAGLMPAAALPPARVDGAGAAAARLSLRAWGTGAVIGLVISALLVYAATGLKGCVIAPLVSFLVAYCVTKLAEQQIGGQTGDVCGAATLLAEIAFLAAALAPFGL